MLSNILPFVLLIVVYLLFALLDVFSLKLPKPQYKLAVWGLCFIMALFAGLRWSEGDRTDYEVYLNIYNHPVDIFNFWQSNEYFQAYISKIDFGYVFISSLFANYVSDHGNVLFTVLAIITTFFLIKSFKRNHIENAIFLILFIFMARLYFQYSFTMMRQALVMAILWYSIPLIIERRFWLFLLICLACATVHFSALIFIVAYWFVKPSFSTKAILITLGVLCVLSTSGIIRGLILISAQAGMSMIGLDDRLAGYLISGTYNKGINPLNFIELAPFVYFALKYRIEITADVYGKFFFNMLIFYTMFILITMDFIALTRFSSYFIYAYFFIISFVFTKLKAPSQRAVIGSLFCLYFSVYVIRYIMFNFTSATYDIVLFHL